MSAPETPASPAVWLDLLALSRRARECRSTDELLFLLVNATHQLSAYRQAACWLQDRGVVALSGVAEPEANAPYVQWLGQWLPAQAAAQPQARRLDLRSLPQALQSDWQEWLPARAAVLSLGSLQPGVLLLARDAAWTDAELGVLAEWGQVWTHAWQARSAGQSLPRWPRLKRWLLQPDAPRPWYRRRIGWMVLALALVLALPVKTSVLAPGEVVPVQPVVVRAPIEGVIARFAVQPNASVQAGALLFEFDPALLASRAEVARQALETAQAQYRQTTQLALNDPKYKPELAAQAGGIAEKRAEYLYLQGQMKRTEVRSPDAGLVLLDDPSTWIGKPVAVGERILRIARPGDVEIEAWLALGDAIDLRQGDPVSLYLLADPLQPLQARLHYLGHEAQLRPDGSYAYRLRARLEGGQGVRSGLKGTARISGRWTVLGYWLLRRPLAVLRTTLGV